MATSDLKLNRFERILFMAALILALLLVVARVAGITLVSVLHHIR
jgi:hypothetical protein